MEKDHLEIILESMDKQFQIILEGHSSLANQIADFKQETKENFDLVNFKIETVAADLKATDERLSKKIDAVDEKLTKKIDAVAADLKATDKKLTKKIDAVADDLKAHRSDTEAHGNTGLYVVRE
jgi:hypothetical protein